MAVALVRPSRPSPLVQSAESYVREAETLRALAHPKRLMLISLIRDEGESVTELAATLGLTLPNVSQHLRVLRDRGVVRAERVGQAVRYRLTNPAFRNCCTLVRQVIEEEDRRHEADLRRALVPREIASVV